MLIIPSHKWKIFLGSIIIITIVGTIPMSRVQLRSTEDLCGVTIHTSEAYYSLCRSVSMLSSAVSGNSCSTWWIIPDAMETVAGWRLQAQSSETTEHVQQGSLISSHKVQARSQTGVKSCGNTEQTCPVSEVMTKTLKDQGINKMGSNAAKLVLCFIYNICQ